MQSQSVIGMLKKPCRIVPTKPAAGWPDSEVANIKGAVLQRVACGTSALTLTCGLASNALVPCRLRFVVVCEPGWANTACADSQNPAPWVTVLKAPQHRNYSPEDGGVVSGNRPVRRVLRH